MLQCKGPCRNWHLQLLTTRFFNQHNRKINFSDPAWLVTFRDEDDENNPLLQHTNNVLDFMDKTGGIVQEIYGLNFNDLMQLDKYTYNKIKKAVFKICERRQKEQEERDRQEEERLKKEEAAQRAAQNRRQ